MSTDAIDRHTMLAGSTALTAAALLPSRAAAQAAAPTAASALPARGEFGSLTPGKRADLILVRTDAPHMGGIGDPYDTLVQLAQPTDVALVTVDGRIPHRNRQFTAVDYSKLLADAAQSVAALKAKAKWS